MSWLHRLGLHPCKDRAPDPKLLRSLLDEARKAGYDLGYKHGRAEAVPLDVRLEAFRKGHSEGFDDGWKAATNTGGG